MSICIVEQPKALGQYSVDLYSCKFMLHLFVQIYQSHLVILYQGEVFARNNFKVWFDFSVDLRNGVDYYLLGSLQNRGLHHALVHLFKVLHIPYLRRLCHSSPMTKSLPSIVVNRLLCTLTHSTEYQKATYKGPGSPFTCITVDNDDVL